MLVLQQVAQKPGRRFFVVSIFGVADAGHLDDEPFGIGRAVDKFNCHLSIS